MKRIKSQSQVYVEIDLHKKFMQVSAMDAGGNELLNEKVPAIKEYIRKFFRIFPKNRQNASWNPHPYGIEYSGI